MNQEKTRHDLIGVRDNRKTTTDTGVSPVANPFIEESQLIGDPHRYCIQDPFHSMNTATGLIPTEISLLIGLLNDLVPL